MRHKLPKFLERETQVFSFLTFKQLIIVGVAIFLLVILYYLIPLGLFIPLAILTLGTLGALTLIKIQGQPLGKRILQFFRYIVGSKQYLWKKKQSSPLTIKRERGEREKEKEEEEEEGTPLKVSKKSRLEKLSSKIERGYKE